MATIRIRTRLEGDVLVLPELRPLIGKTVDIEVTERSDESARADRWAAAAAAVKGLASYDFEASPEQRAFDAAHAEDHLR